MIRINIQNINFRTGGIAMRNSNFKTWLKKIRQLIRKARNGGDDNLILNI